MLKKSFLITSILALTALVMPAKPSLPTVVILGKSYYCYEAGKGDSLFGIGKKFDWDPEVLASHNPNLESPIKKGTLIYYPADGEIPTDTEPSGQQTKTVNITHEVKAGETLYSIARTYRLKIDDIYRMNPDAVKGIRVGETIIIGEREADETPADAPDYAEGESSENSTGADTAANSPETPDAPDSDNNIISENDDDESVADSTVNKEKSEVRVAIVLEDTSTIRDMEFTRGALLAVDRMKSEPFKSVVTVLDGADPSSKVLTQLETFNPDLIIFTSDKVLPQYLTDYSSRTQTELVNAFDTRNEAYLDNPYIFQFLTPTTYFNEAATGFIADRFGGYRLIVAGEPEANDNFYKALSSTLETAGENVAVEDISDYPSEDFDKYIIYGTPTKRDDVSALLDEVVELKTKSPLAEVAVLGRPNWITFTESLRQKLDAASAMVPSRFFFSADNPDNRRFIDDYGALYGRTPVKSYPVYAVAGYDIMTCFMPNIAAFGGDFNAGFRKTDTLQSSISLKRAGETGGLYNPDCYIVIFDTLGEPHSIVVNAR